MSTDWLPFYGAALGTIGGLVLALVASLTAQRQKWTIFTGSLFIFLGFMLQAIFYLQLVLPK